MVYSYLPGTLSEVWSLHTGLISSSGMSAQSCADGALPGFCTAGTGCAAVFEGDVRLRIFQERSAPISH